jgi:thiol-disulfide isomerase/thioredoxin
MTFDIKSKLPSKKFMVILLLSFLFLGIAFYVYNTYITPKINPDFVPNKEFVEEKNAEYPASIYLFYADWCPYSQKAKKTWDNLKTNLNNKKINKYVLHFEEINDERDASKLKDFETTYKKTIDGFPTIIMIKDDNVIEFEAKPNQDTLNEFIHSVL